MTRCELMDDGGPVLVIEGDTARPVDAGDCVPCAICDGAGIRRPTRRGDPPSTCSTCDAIGRLSRQCDVLIRFGWRLWSARGLRGTLRAEAKRCGLSPRVMADQEMGRCCLRCDQGPEQCRCTETELEQAAREQGRLP